MQGIALKLPMYLIDRRPSLRAAGALSGVPLGPKSGQNSPVHTIYAQPQIPYKSGFGA